MESVLTVFTFRVAMWNLISRHVVLALISQLERINYALNKCGLIKLECGWRWSGDVYSKIGIHVTFVFKRVVVLHVRYPFVD